MSDEKKEWNMYEINDKEDEADRLELSNLSCYDKCKLVVDNSAYPEPKQQAFITKYEAYKAWRLEAARNYLTQELLHTKIKLAEEKIKKLQGGVQ